VADVRLPATASETPVVVGVATAHRRRWPRVVLAAAFVLGLLAVYLLTLTRTGATNDIESADVAGWRIAATGTPWLDGVDLAALPHVSEKLLWTVTTDDGHLTISRSPGVVAAAIPGYLLTGADGDPHHFSLVPGAVTAAVLTTLAMLLLLGSLRGLLATPRRYAAVAILALGTPVWSVAADDLYPHAVTLPGIAGMAWAVRRERWWLAGVFGGVALWGRLHCVLIVALLGLGLAVWRRRPRIAVEMGLTSGVLLGLASLWSHWMYGHASPSGGYGSPGDYAGKAADTSHLHQVVNELGLLVAPDRGLLVWTPLLLLLLPAVVRSWRGAPDWTRLLAVAGLVYLAVQGLLNEFPGGSGFFGYRLTLETLACLFPLYAVSLPAMGRWARALVGPLAGLQVGAFLIGSIGHRWMLDITESWHDNALWYAVRTVPQLSTLLVLAVLLGLLASRIWRDRRL